MKKILLVFFVLAITITIVSSVSFAKNGYYGAYESGERNLLLGSSNEERYISFTLYAGPYAYFESGDEKIESIESIQFKGDVFSENRTPILWNEEGAKYFVGWATTCDAEESDIIPGVTENGSIINKGAYKTYIYAVWADDEYYFESGDHTWIKGNDDGITFVVHRHAPNIETSTMFRSLIIDGNEIEEGYHIDGSDLELTLYPELLETLDSGEHEMTIVFKPDNDYGESGDIVTTTTTFMVIDNIPSAGDLDGNGKIEILDVRLLLQEFINSNEETVWTQKQLALMDMDLNGIINIIDVRLLLQEFINS